MLNRITKNNFTFRQLEAERKIGKANACNLQTINSMGLCLHCLEVLTDEDIDKLNERLMYQPSVFYYEDYNYVKNMLKYLENELVICSGCRNTFKRKGDKLYDDDNKEYDHCIWCQQKIDIFKDKNKKMEEKNK